MSSVDPVLGLSFWLGAALALVCGGAVGLERQLRGKPAGIRTSVLICLATSTFVRLGVQLQPEGGDSTRILGQLVVGVGFLGAGAIMNRERTITGMTSAAVIWMLAGIGAAIGLDLWGTALSLTGLTLGTLVGIEALERLFAVLRRGVHARPHEPAGGAARPPGDHGES